MRERFDVAVIGGGAAGLVAAISAARRGASAVVLERLPRPGKKLLATGGGRANLLNENLLPAAFTTTDPGLVASVLGRFGKGEILSFFAGLGLRTQVEADGRVYPVTGQASSVLKVLELEVGRLGVPVRTGFTAASVAPVPGGFSIAAEEGPKLEAVAVVLAGGGKSYPALGSNGSCYVLAGRFGHRVVAPVPSAVPLLVKDRMCHLLQGQKVKVRARGAVEGREGPAVDGELLFTQYGLSGTAALDVSEALSIALNRDGRKDVSLVVDFVPFLSEPEWAARDLGTGLLPDRFGAVLPQALSDPAAPRQGAADAKAGRLAAALKTWRFAVHGTRGWNEAEFTAGGVDAREVKRRTLESKLRAGLYFAGEVLDVQGGRGGYNLAWAWSSGFVAGLTE
jgi:predicted Rossmann fold flavoprotein